MKLGIIIHFKISVAFVLLPTAALLKQQAGLAMAEIKIKYPRPMICGGL